MPPKNKYTREEVIQAALEIVRSQGIKALTARSLAQGLGTSTKPIFGLFENMQQVQNAVLEAANAIYQRQINAAMKSGQYPPYKASGMGYIRFAKEEPHLFKWLFMRDRTGESTEEKGEELRPILEVIQNNLGIPEEQAYLFHREMWLGVHGIATMIATGYLDWDMEFVSNALTDLYQGLRYRFQEGIK